MINKLLGIAENASEHGYMVDHTLEVVHWFMAFLFVGWTCFFLYTLYRFNRRRNPKADYHGVKSAASTHLEAGVVIVEAILLLGLAFPLWAKRVNAFPTDENPIRVKVVCEQFLFNIHYPGADGIFGKQRIDLVSASNPLGLDASDPDGRDDIVTRNELRVPVGRPVIIELSSKDVIHNFDVYTMRSAQDAIPGSVIPMWFTPVKVGESEIICAQLCGSGHYAMKAALNVMTAAEFEEWLKSAAPTPTVASR